MIKSISLFATAALLCLPIAQADMIDFEGFAPGTTLGPVIAATNTVTFAVGSAGPGGPATVVGVGAPTESFSPNDTPSGGMPGLRFLSDNGTGPSSGISANYFLVFATPISMLALDTYDYGDVPGGGMITLTMFTDAGFTTVAGATTVAGSAADASVIPISVSGAPALSASLTFSAYDPGVGVDNVDFQNASIPEPMTITLFGVGLLALGLIRRRRK